MALGIINFEMLVHEGVLHWEKANSSIDIALSQPNGMDGRRALV